MQAHLLVMILSRARVVFEGQQGLAHDKVPCLAGWRGSRSCAGRYLAGPAMGRAVCTCGAPWNRTPPSSLPDSQRRAAPAKPTCCLQRVQKGQHAGNGSA